MRALIHDEILGTLRYERGSRGYEGTIALDGGDVALHLLVQDGEDVATVMTSARQIACDIERHARDARRFAAEALIDLKNHTWRDDDEPPVTAETFEASIRLRAVSVRADGSADLWHDDGEMFFGHGICVRMAGDGRYVDADIAG